MSNKIKLKSHKDIENLHISAKVLARTLNLLVESTRPGISTDKLDTIAHDFIISNEGCTPAFLNYQPYGADYPYPATMCISVNEVVVHGIPDSYELIVGDIVSYDGGVVYNGMISDSAVSVIVTEDGCTTIRDILKKVGSETDIMTIDLSKLDDKEKLLYHTYKSMHAGIQAMQIGSHINDISRVIEKAIPREYGIVKTFSGHGVGYHVHEEPYVPNYDDGVRGARIQAGMVLAIEPMLTLGTDEVDIMEDSYTAMTSDGSLAAHFEHTVVATENGPEILTLIPSPPTIINS